MGFAGQVSLGHAGFFGSAPMRSRSVRLFRLCRLARCSRRGSVRRRRFLVGRPILRLRGHYLAMATLGFGVIISIVISNEAGGPAGPDGMSVPRLSLFGWTRCTAGGLVLVVRRCCCSAARACPQPDRQPGRAGAARAARLRDRRRGGRHRQRAPEGDGVRPVGGLRRARGRPIGALLGFITPDGRASCTRSSWSRWWSSAAWRRPSARWSARRC